MMVRMLGVAMAGVGVIVRVGVCIRVGVVMVVAVAQRAPAHYQEITRRAQAAFPDYGLPYMVEYGVYGLVNAKL